MPSPKTQPARGMRDFLPADVRKREYVIGVIKSVYERYGFEPLETPAVENIETLMGKYGEEGNQLIFKILKRGEHEKTGEADLALRYDLTVPLARVVAQYQNELPKFFKRYQIQPVWRADRPARGRFREFYQCDVDVLGSKSMVVEAELIAAASDALKELGFKDYAIRLNHRRLMDAMMSSAMIEGDKRSGVLVVLDKLTKIGAENVKKELSAFGIPERSIDNLLHRMTDRTFLAQDGKVGFHEFSLDRYESNMEMLDLVLSSYKHFSNEHEAKIAVGDAYGDLKNIVYLTANTSAAKHIHIDPSLARGLSYYTGAIMEIQVKDLPGSVGGGGRYDKLIGRFLDRDIPACGLSLGLERIILVLTERKLFPLSLVNSPAEVMVCMFDEESTPYAIELSNELRTQELRVLLHPEVLNPGKQLMYARNLNIPFMIVIGSNERETGKLVLRNTKIRGGDELPRSGIAEVIKAQLEILRREEQERVKRLAFDLEIDTTDLEV